MSRVKVEGYTSLVRDVNSNGIVNTNVSEYQTYMKRIRMRNQQGDEIRSAVKEINNLKAELREIKGLIKELVKN
tara:strand:+ start:806 stop:1027 length:222 start_codon:yes stop_codon:yes gene_type:complete